MPMCRISPGSIFIAVLCLAIVFLPIGSPAQDGAVRSGEKTSGRSGEKTSGPIPLGNQSVFAQPRLGLRPWAGGDLTGSPVADLRFVWSNTNQVKEFFLVDAETQLLEFGTAVSLTPSTVLSVHQPLIWRGGGVLDRFVSEWHDFGGFPNGNRDDRPEDAYAVQGTYADGEHFSVPSAHGELTGLELAIRQLLMNENGTTLALHGAMKLPTATDEFAPNRPDFLFGAESAATNGRTNFFLSIAALVLSDDSVTGVRYEQLQGQGLFGVNYQLNDTLALLAQSYAETALLEDIQSYPSFSATIDVGTKIRLTDRVILPILFREDFIGQKAFPDFSILLGIEGALGR